MSPTPATMSNPPPNDNVDSSPASTSPVSRPNSTDIPTPGAAKNPAESDVEKTVNVKIDQKLATITWYTIRMTILVALGGFIFGYDTGQISGFLEMAVFRARFGEETSDLSQHPSGFYFTRVRSGLLVGLLSIGTMCGCFITGPLADKVGRKICISGCCFIVCIGVIAQISAGNGNWIGIAMGRWVSGLGVGGLSTIVPMYMAETSPVHMRGAVISCYQLFIAMGMFTAFCINYGTNGLTTTASYRIPMGINFTSPIILGLGMCFLPESPRYDWKVAKIERARESIAKFYGCLETHAVVLNECAEMKKAHYESLGRQRWYEAIMGPRMVYRIALAMALQMFQQLTGANYYFYYGTSIFAGVGIENSYITAMILGGVNVGGTFLGVYMARHFRRRESLCIAALVQSVCFIVFASVGKFALNEHEAGSHEAYISGIIMIVFACLFISAYAATWGPLVWTCIAEMFPTKSRAVAMSFATASNWFWNFILAFCTPFITREINFAYGYVFAACNILAAITVFFFLIESSGRPLEAVHGMYLQMVDPIKSHAFQFPRETNVSSVGSRESALKNQAGQVEKIDKDDHAEAPS
ncbi:hypothetical protein DSL72_006735 [Monilinia vaccinii-corymbosi]|uniref:Major facilitator superfamily (MFS) profile domain-containing protein n=1 Tax=Monilinia vaccinii-corymbosi TaxID=61207 RepID=A0A8A3PN02_9HELO|nr:hypothetical protein DSL72_006735 [Monilinia vaccinii-corymbosi]